MTPLDAPDEQPQRATQADAAAITELLVDAFDNDEMWGPWAFPDPGVVPRERRKAVFSVLVDGALRYPWVWVTRGVTAASLWIPPAGKELSTDQEATLTAVLAESLPETLGRLTAGFELIEAARPREEHYYLTLLGSSPSVAGQRRGLGLLRHTLALIDAAGAPAYLEAADHLVPFYQRLGFTVVGGFVLPGGPNVNTMWRPGSRQQPDETLTAQ